MKVLIACEESQIECLAFRRYGFDAYSCDIKDCSGGHTEWHIKADAIETLFSDSWDLIIAHPPCTYLSNCQNFRLKDLERQKLALKARDFFMSFFMFPTPSNGLAIENPKPCSFVNLPPYQQVIEPYFFGDPYTKYTCLWLHGLSPLVATNIVKPIASFVSLSRDSESRSKSFPGIADAMARQWGLGEFQMQSLL